MALYWPVPYRNSFSWMIGLTHSLDSLVWFSPARCVNTACRIACSPAPRGVCETSRGANVTCVLPPPRSSAATVLRPVSLPSRKLTVNQEKMPSSVPSMISTACALTRKPDDLNSSRQAASSASAWAGGSNRSPAVAFSTSGVWDSFASGTTRLARSSSLPMLAAPSSGRPANADRPGFDCSNSS
uniref:Uncharacterized protein n=1 Tax=Anopheles melas TaxID=34690 RepID=A0A182UAB7_9DIPT